MTSKKVYINISNKYDRIVVLVDMDCFYCQVEEKLNPNLAGKPIAVVQYNTWQGGGIIAVNYRARAEGVTRHMRGEEAKEQCPEIELARVPNIRGKADLTKYREAGKEVAVVLQSFTPLLERASVDEAYLDITEIVLKRLEDMNNGTFQLKPNEFVNTFAVGYEHIGDYIHDISSNVNVESQNIDFNFEHDEDDMPAIQKSDLKLLIGASIVHEIRMKVKEKTGYECSAGIAHNKILAKLACGMNKPNKQTILPLSQIKKLFNTLPVGKIKGLGGKFGEDVCERLRIKCIGDLEQFSENELQRKFDEKNGSWLYLICRGIDLEAVTPKLYAKSIGCCKKFPGLNCINGIKTLNHWLLELSKEICDRMDKDEVENNRRPKQMVISYIQELNGEDVSSSRSTNMISKEPEVMAKYAFDVIRKNTDQFLKSNNENSLNNSIKFLGISVGKFESIETKQNTLQKMFLNHSKKKPTDVETSGNDSSTLCGTVEELSVRKQNNDTSVKMFLNHSNKNEGKGMPHRDNNDFLRLDSEVKESTTETQNDVLELVPPKNSFFASYFKKENEKNINDEISEKRGNDDQTGGKENSFFLKLFREEINQNINTNMPKNVMKYDSNISAESLPIEEIIQHFPKTNNVIYTSLNNESELHDNDSNTNLNNKIPSTSKQCLDTNNDYTKDYVEFAIPEPNEDNYIKCEKCSKKILSYTLEVHMDYHIALEISKKQREEYRQELKSKIKSPPAKKSKPSNGTNKLENNKNKTNNHSNSNKTIKNINAIEKFLIKKEEKDNSVNDNDNNDDSLELCLECGKRIPISKLLEHSDYHAAKKLQAELNRQESLNRGLPSKSSVETTKSNNVDNDATHNKVKSIETYFS